jgi:hypothetical protein
MTDLQQAPSAGAVPPPSDRFVCERFACTISTSACVARQELRRRVGPLGRTIAVHQPCGDGTCEQGNLVRLTVRGAAPAPVARSAPAAQPRLETARLEKPRPEKPIPAVVEAGAPPSAVNWPSPKKGMPEARRRAIAESVRATVQRKRENGAKTCGSGCGRLLRADSKGEKCSFCLRARKSAPPGPIARAAAEALRSLAAPPPLPQALPSEYLANCIAEARRRIAEAELILKVLTGAEPAAVAATLHG